MWRWFRGIVRRPHRRTTNSPSSKPLIEALEGRITPTVSLFDGNNSFVRNFAGAAAIQQAIDADIPNAHVIVYNDAAYTGFVAGVAGQSILGRDVNTTYSTFPFQGDSTVPALGTAVSTLPTVNSSGSGTTVTLSGSNVALDSLKIVDGSASDAVGVQVSANGVTVSNSTIQQYAQGIVAGAGVSGLKVTHDALSTTGTALEMSGAASATVVGNTIIGGAGEGIRQSSGGAGGLTIQGNTISAEGSGIDLFDISGVIQIGGSAAGQGNTVTTGDAASAIFAGWANIAGTTIAVQGNTVVGGQTGIDIFNGQHGTITIGGNTAAAGNSVTGSETGIFVRISINALYVENNVLADIGTYGIRLSGAGMLVQSGIGTTLGTVDVIANNVSSTSGDTGLLFDDGIQDQYHYYNNITANQNTVIGFSTGVEVANKGQVFLDQINVSDASTGIGLDSGNRAVEETFLTVTSGNVSASDRGLYVNGNGYGTSSNAVSVSNLTITITGTDGAGVDLESFANVTLSNVTIDLPTSAGNTATGINVGGAELTLGTAVSVNSGQTGLRISNTEPVTNVYDSYLNGNTLSNISFTGETGDYIDLGDGALSGQEIDATSASFDGFVGGTAPVATPANLAAFYGVGDRIDDVLDGPGVGFVRLKHGYVFVNQDDEASTPGAIQRAVGVAGNQDTIEVQAGAYSGDLNITKPLTLLGAQAGVDPRLGRAGPESVIVGAGVTAPVRIAPGTNGVVINGFTIQSPAGGSGSLNAGIRVDGGTGLTIDYDILENNTAGVAIGSGSGSIGFNLIRGNNENLNQAAGSGTGINFFAPGAGAWTISNNRFSDNDNEDILINGGDTVANVSITTNQFVSSPGYPLSAFMADRLIFSGNTITNPVMSAVNLGGGVTNATINGDTITDGRSRAILAQIEGSGTGPNANVTISGNIINQSAALIPTPMALIDLETDAGVTAVSDNVIAVSNLTNQQITGIGLNGAGSILVQGNTIKGANDGVSGVATGINVGAGSTATLLANTVDGGTGTAFGIVVSGTANLGDDTASNANLITGWTGPSANGVLVAAGGAARLLKNTVTGNNIGVMVNAGTALLQDNELRNDTVNGAASAGLRITNGAVVDAGQDNPATQAVEGINFTGLGISKGGNLFNWSATPAGGYAQGGAMAIVNDNAFPGSLPTGSAPVQAPNLPAQFNDFGTTVYGNIEQVVFHYYDSGDALVDYRNAVGATAPALEAVNGPGSLNPFLRIFPVDPAANATIDAVNQRSMIRAIQFQLDSPVVLGTSPAGLTRLGANTYAWYAGALPTGAVPISVSSTIDGGTGRTTVTVRFANPNTGAFNGSMTQWGSLIDGNYSLGFQGSAAELLFAGSGLTAQDHTDLLYRFYGDENGDRVVNQLDLNQFLSTFNASVGNPVYLASLDADGSGTVDQLDLGQFRVRYNRNIP